VTDLDAAYLAGIIDGEGSISLIAPYRRSRGGRVEISVANTSEALIGWLIATGFKASILRKQRARVHHKQAFEWKVRGVAVRQLLLAVLPYLVSKRPQAELALQFLETLRLPGRGKANQLSAEVIDIRLRLIAEGRRLNQRGMAQEVI